MSGERVIMAADGGRLLAAGNLLTGQRMIASAGAAPCCDVAGVDWIGRIRLRDVSTDYDWLAYCPTSWSHCGASGANNLGGFNIYTPTAITRNRVPQLNGSFGGWTEIAGVYAVQPGASDADIVAAIGGSTRTYVPCPDTGTEISIIHDPTAFYPTVPVCWTQYPTFVRGVANVELVIRRGSTAGDPSFDCYDACCYSDDPEDPTPVYGSTWWKHQLRKYSGDATLHPTRGTFTAVIDVPGVYASAAAFEDASYFKSQSGANQIDCSAALSWAFDLSGWEVTQILGAVYRLRIGVTASFSAHPGGTFTGKCPGPYIIGFECDEAGTWSDTVSGMGVPAPDDTCWTENGGDGTASANHKTRFAFTPVYPWT
jgi:hypothetical protein